MYCIGNIYICASRDAFVPPLAVNHVHAVTTPLEIVLRACVREHIRPQAPPTTYSCWRN